MPLYAGHCSDRSDNGVSDCGACFSKLFMCMITFLMTDCNYKYYAPSSLWLESHHGMLQQLALIPTVIKITRVCSIIYKFYAIDFHNNVIKPDRFEQGIGFYEHRYNWIARFCFNKLIADYRSLIIDRVLQFSLMIPSLMRQWHNILANGHLVQVSLEGTTVTSDKICWDGNFAQTRVAIKSFTAQKNACCQFVRRYKGPQTHFEVI